MGERMYDTYDSIFDILDPEDSAGVTFVGRTGRISTSSRADLIDGARAWATVIDDHIDDGDRVVICLPTSPEFLHAYFGTIIAGGVAVPLPSIVVDDPDYMESFLGNRSMVINDAGAEVLLTADAFAEPLSGLMEFCEELHTVLTPSAIEERAAGEDGTSFEPIPMRRGDLAMLQYTSGSTARPKGVELTHGCLLSNLDAITAGLGGIEADDACVSWLPLYHDMGLIGGCLCALAAGLSTTLMAPEVFLHDPGFFLQAITRQQGTITVQPNFAFGLAAKRVAEETLGNYDLSSMRVMMCGAEPVNPETLAAFQDKFSRCGLPADVIMPVYGMAEATLAVTFRPPGAPVKTARLSRTELQNNGRIVDAGPADDVFEVPSVGAPLMETRVKIVDGEGREVGEDVEGEILIDSPSVMRGYWNNPEATEEALDGGWFHSGDLGFLRDGELYVTGRIKDLIITYGRNFYPHDIERVAGEVEGVRKGCLAAFGIRNEENSTQEIVLIAETRETERDALIDLRRRVRKELINTIECNPRHVVLVGPREVPKTTSGKVRRHHAQKKFEEEEGYERLL